MQSPIRNRRTVFNGRVVKVEEANLDFGGKQAIFELVRFNVETGVSALPVEDDHVWLIEHYQLGIDQVALSLPTGGLNQGENPEKRMNQELQEEIGMKAGKLTLMARINTLPGYIGTDPGYLYLAQELKEDPLPGDEAYPITTRKIALTKALEMVEQGIIKDGRTMLALLWYDRFNR